MNRSELIRMFVLDAIADDYENLEQITKHITRLSSDCGMAVTPSVVLQALDELIAAGLAKAYRLSNQIEEIGGMPPPDEIGSPNESLTDDAYFWVTEDGRRLQLADCPAWPFDDNNTLRADWRLPEN